MNRIIATAAAAALTITALAGCTRTVVVHDSPPASTVATVDPVPVVDSPAPFDYKAAGLTIDLKVTSKQCFGDAGCNVTVKPELSVDDPSSVPDTASGEVTYTITGDESGPVIGTLTLTGSQYDGTETFLSTSGSGVTPKASITDITTDGQ